MLFRSCAVLQATTPLVVTIALLGAAGALRSMQMTSMNTLAFADIEPAHRGAASTLSTMCAQMASALGAAVGALALALSQMAHGRTALAAVDFMVAFGIMGVLALIGEGFATCKISPDAGTVQVGPGIIGGEVNFRLAPHGRKIGPDPASINACKIGGIAANNASGMCCGTSQNSYRTLAGMRVILADGTLLDTEDPASVASFQHSHADLLQQLAELGRQTRVPPALRRRHGHRGVVGCLPRAVRAHARVVLGGGRVPARAAAFGALA